MCQSHRSSEDDSTKARGCNGRGGCGGNGDAGGECRQRFSDQHSTPTQNADHAEFTNLTGSVLDRRSGVDRRDMAKAAGQEEDSTGLERRRGPGRRRTDFTKSAEEGEMTSEQFLFISAIEAFKRSNNKMFPTWTDVLEVVRLLGYRKTMPSELSLRNVEDWREKPDTASGVRSKPGHPEERREAA